MTDIPAPQKLPKDVAAIKERGVVTWSSASKELASDFVQLFDENRVPVVAIRHVRQWGIQVDDERELMGHERTSIDDEELWQAVLKAKDGSTYEVNCKFVRPVSA
jgi:hypothetical protein